MCGQNGKGSIVQKSISRPPEDKVDPGIFHFITLQVKPYLFHCQFLSRFATPKTYGKRIAENAFRPAKVKKLGHEYRKWYAKSFTVSFKLRKHLKYQYLNNKLFMILKT
jgi:hypothetical protein